MSERAESGERTSINSGSTVKRLKRQRRCVFGLPWPGEKKAITIGGGREGGLTGWWGELGEKKREGFPSQ